MSEIITEDLVIKNILHNDEYCDAVLTTLKNEYFEDATCKRLFKIISKYNEKYSAIPKKSALTTIIENAKGLSEEDYNTSLEAISDLCDGEYDSPDIEWLMETTLNWTKHRAMNIAIHKALEIYDNGVENYSEVPELMEKVLSIDFDRDLGHDYVEDAKKRNEYYLSPKHRIPFMSDTLNRITGGGYSRKTLNIIIAPPHGGKTAKLINLASTAVQSGLNVVYFTLEMAEEEIAKRIDANLMNINMSLVEKLTRAEFDKKIEHVRSKVKGKLIIKEYPTSEGSVAHFKNFLKELQRSKKFKPDVIIVDYMNICASTKMRTKDNSYAYVGSVAEDLRAFAQKTDTALWTATQTNRDGSKGEIDTDNFSESFSPVGTADFILAIMRDEEAIENDVMNFKQLKNRYHAIGKRPKFQMGFDYKKMRIYDLDNPEVEDVPDDATEDMKKFKNRTTNRAKTNIVI